MGGMHALPDSFVVRQLRRSAPDHTADSGIGLKVRSVLETAAAERKFEET
jgi:hypothetical protein